MTCFALRISPRTVIAMTSTVMMLVLTAILVVGVMTGAIPATRQLEAAAYASVIGPACCLCLIMYDRAYWVCYTDDGLRGRPDSFPLSPVLMTHENLQLILPTIRERAPNLLRNSLGMRS